LCFPCNDASVSFFSTDQCNLCLHFHDIKK
jgi:hypothetical protein